MPETAAEDFGEALIAVINDHGHLDAQEQFAVIVNVLCIMITSIDCPHCRELAVKDAKRMFAKMLAHSMKQAHPDNPHVHH